jgi:hypothetical protein
MKQKMILQSPHYRALEGTNTKTRRLAYLTAVVSMLGHSSLSERTLLTKIARWSQDQKLALEDYWVQTGEVTSTRRNSAGARYLHLATNLGLIASISGAYRATRVGLVLFALLQQYDLNLNPFFLTQCERLFYLFSLMSRDADIILAVTDYLEEHPGSSLAHIQTDFQETFISRLGHKLATCRDDKLRQSLLERRSEVERWTKPKRYAEHIIPPRLNWLLDLDFFEPGRFRRHRYIFTEAGVRFLSALPHIDDTNFSDIGDEWLTSGFWTVAVWRLLGTEPLSKWNELDEENRQVLCAPLLIETFRTFQRTVVPRVSLTQAMLYLVLRLVLEHKVAAGPAFLAGWLATPLTVGNQRYEVRFSPRENESYLIVMPA